MRIATLTTFYTHILTYILNAMFNNIYFTNKIYSELEKSNLFRSQFENKFKNALIKFIMKVLAQ